MLSLTRTEGERVLLTLADGTEVWIVVREISRTWVRLAIDAPQTVRIARADPAATWKGKA